VYKFRCAWHEMEPLHKVMLDSIVKLPAFKSTGSPDALVSEVLKDVQLIKTVRRDVYLHTMPNMSTVGYSEVAVNCEAGALFRV
jgi:hypothetical protein